ncbi:phage tail protein [Roseisolibacter agri]|uniref:Tip attachment protein J domain-containing protein n=1 Tax=Roseisolibacter agri TaxID=2014610 RepID=A0AA37QFY5_9BACT|nr:phage tail protein [Roseisolibacter agri]GLC25058.1 hypothetical protein rosag_15710 [Roseisolibacter agri]
MPAFLVAFAVNVSLALLSSSLQSLTRRDPKAPTPEKPRVQSGDPLPLIFGTVKMPCRVVDWWGAHQEDVNEGQRAFLNLVGRQATKAHRYKVSMVTVLGYGTIHAVSDLIVDGKSVAAVGTRRVLSEFDPADGRIEYATVPALQGGIGGGGVGTLTLTAPNMLGGTDGNGGVQGTVHIRGGRGGASPVPYYDTRYAGATDTTLAPDWRHFAYLVFEDTWLGNSPVLPSLHAVVSRWPGTIGEGDNGDAGIGGILAELISDPHRGCGYPRSELGSSFGLPTTAWGYGLSFTVEAHTPAETVLRDVLRAADAVLYTDPVTGLLEVCAHRGPGFGGFQWGTLAGLLDLNPSNTLACEWTAPEPASRFNQVRLAYVDRAQGFTRQVVTATHGPRVAADGEIIAIDIDMPMIGREAVARRVAERELRAQVLPLGKATLKCTRAAAGLRPGSVFRLNRPELQLTDVVMRVLDVDLGAPGDEHVVVDAIQDHYALGVSGITTAVTERSPSPTPAAGVETPIVNEYTSQTATVGTLTLSVQDPQERVTAVEVATQSGRGAVSAWMDATAITGSRYTGIVTLDPLNASRIAWRVTYTAPGSGGADEERVIEGVVAFDPAQSLPAPALSYAWTGADSVLVTAEMPSGVTLAGVRLVADDTDPPTAGEVAAAALDAAAPYALAVTGIGTGESVYVAARAETSGGAVTSPLARLTITRPGVSGSEGSGALAFVTYRGPNLDDPPEIVYDRATGEPILYREL